MKRCITSFIVALSVISTMGFTVDAANPVQLQATNIYGSSVDYTGYSIKVYYTDLYGEQITTQTEALSSTGLASFTPPSGTYGFGYEVLDSSGEIIREYEKILSGNADYWTLTEPLSVNITTAAEKIDGNIDVSGNDTSNITQMDLSVFGMNDSQLSDNYNDSTSSTTSTDTGYSAQIKVTSDYNLDLMHDQGFYIYAQTASEAYRIDITEISGDFDTYSLPSDADYTFGVYENKTTVWKDITVTETSPNRVQVNVTPNCLLYVQNGGNAVNIKVSSNTYAYDQQAVFGVVNGETYTIINTDNNRAYSFIVPTNVTACMLDLSTMTGVPVNEAALQDAYLSDTGDYDNPYNIPLTNQSGNKNFTAILLVCITAVLSVAALLTKKILK